MQVGLTAVASRISLKKIVANLKEATVSYTAMRAANVSKDPPYAAVLADLEALAVKYAATHGNKETMALLSRGTVMEVVPQQPGPKKQPPKPKPKPRNVSASKQSRGQCWFYKSGSCNRGAQCPFDHDTEADEGETSGARGTETPVTSQTVCSAAVVRGMTAAVVKPPYRAPPYERVKISDLGNQCEEVWVGVRNEYAMVAEDGETRSVQEEDKPLYRAPRMSTSDFQMWTVSVRRVIQARAIDTRCWLRIERAQSSSNRRVQHITGLELSLGMQVVTQMMMYKCKSMQYGL